MADAQLDRSRAGVSLSSPSLVRGDTMVELLGRTGLFGTLGAEQRALVAEHMSLRRYTPGELLLTDGEVDDAVHVIARGEVEIVKATRKREDVVLRRLGLGTCLGEVKLFGRGRSTATVRAKTHVTCASLRLDQLARGGPLEPVRAAIFLAGGELMAERMNVSSADAVEAIRSELAQSQMRLFAGRFLLMIVTVMSVFTLLISLMNSLAPELLPPPFVLSFVLITASTAFMSIGIALSPFSARDAGLRFDRIWTDIERGFMWTAPWMVLIVLVKLALSGPGGPYAGQPLFDPGALFYAKPFDAGIFALAVLGYSVHTPMQELMIRVGIQFPMDRLLSPESDRVNWLAIIVSNLCFAAFHTYLSLGFALISFLPGVYWGYIYARERSVLASTVSHWLLGLWSLFVVGLQSAF